MKQHICTLLLATALPAMVLIGCSGGSGGSMNAGPTSPRPTTVSLGDVPDHGLQAMAAPLAIAAGTSQTLGNVTVTCRLIGPACSVSMTETADGTLTVTSTGGVATVAYSQAYIDDIANNQLVTKWQQFEQGNPTLALSVNHALAKYNTVAQVETHTIIGSQYEADGSAWRKWGEGAISEKPEDLSYDLLEPVTGLTEGVILKPVLEHNRVALLQSSFDAAYETSEGPPCVEDDHDCGSDIVEYYERAVGENYWAMLDYSLFVVGRARYCEGPNIEICNEHQSAVWDHDIDADSYGLYRATNPRGVGSATWTGIMTGLDVGSYEAPASGLLLGEASVDIDDLSNPDVDVSFTGMYDVSGGIRHRDMLWHDLALTDGAFNDGAPRIQQPLARLRVAPGA